MESFLAEPNAQTCRVGISEHIVTGNLLQSTENLLSALSDSLEYFITNENSWNGRCKCK